ncbi:penicillin-binding transpeptidase domain-containing protein [Streptomyces sp. RFCAC02]|uniref:penicillin-binding transpeptidase domain-containing protein n=1 Tax=Streptomyces sp. RFCAC02 TaxID=2499143 RepID=UPI0019D0A4A6|nr:penicillin-binding transpeptidase domain-containing protein [Streptomyces sp. RFCAC02]
MRNGQRIAVIAGTSAAVVALVGFGAYSLLGDDGDDQAPASATTDGGPAGGEATEDLEPPTAEEITQASAAFLDAWARGDAAAAAALTDDPEAARAALEALSDSTGFADAVFEPAAPEGAEVPFSVAATVSAPDDDRIEPAAWEYTSRLEVVRDAGSGEAVVAWRPAVLHPALGDGLDIEVGPVAEAAPADVLDADGGVLTADDHPTLAPIIDELAERYGTTDPAGGSTGAELRIVDIAGETVESLLTLAEPVPGEIPTTIDPALQQAAEAAVADRSTAAVVAVQPSTGAIRAVANSPADGMNLAFEGSYAPGSTFKIVTASLLIDRGLAAADEPHPCPQYFEVGGWRFQNLDEFEIEGGTFADSFAASCNTAFISQAPELADDDLGNQARDYFGLGLTWSIGVPSMDGQVPTQSDAQMAASLIGQGGVRMNPLNMASVSATVQSGVFRQPYLVSTDFAPRELATAPRSLDGSTAQELRALMNRTATNGTAAAALAGLGGDIGGKTGSAEVDGQDKPNAWFTAYQGDLAAAALVPESGHGGDNAGPIVADVLRADG